MPFAAEDLLPPPTSGGSENQYSINEGGRIVLLDAYDGGRHLSADEAIAKYRSDKVSIGKFESPEKVKEFLSGSSSSSSSSPAASSSSRKTSGATADSAGYTLADLLPPAASSAPPQGTSAFRGEHLPEQKEGFLEKTWDTAKAVGHLLTSMPDMSSSTKEELQAKLKEHDAATSVGKAFTGGLISMGETVPAGYNAIYQVAKAKVQGKDLDQGVNKAVDDLQLHQEAMALIHEDVAKYTKINLAPENQTDELMSRVLNIPMDAAHATGLTIFEHGGPAWLAAGAEGLAVGLMLKPSLLSKALRVIPRGRAAGEFEATFRERMKASREEAYDYADKVVAKTDPELADRMKKETLTQPGMGPDGEPVAGITPKEQAASTAAVTARVAAVGAAGAKVDNAFKELVIKDRDAAEKIADHVAKADPDLGAELKAKTKGRATNEKIDEVAKAAVEAETIKGKDAEALHPRGESGPIHPGWKDIGMRIAPALDERMKAGGKFTSHELLDLMAKNTDHPVFSGILRKIRSVADNFEVTGSRKPIDYRPGEVAEGVYDAAKHTAQIYIPEKGSVNAPYVIAHEIVHGATSRFLELNPEHQVTKDLTRLLNYARRRATRMKVAEMHGLNDVHEFVSEAMTNTEFQRFLIESEKFKHPLEKAADIMHSLAKVVQRLYGVKEGAEAQLFHEVFYHTDKAFEAQKVMKKGEKAGGVHAGDVIEGNFEERRIKKLREDIAQARAVSSIREAKQRQAMRQRWRQDPSVLHRIFLEIDDIKQTPISERTREVEARLDYLQQAMNKVASSERLVERGEKGFYPAPHITEDQASAGIRNSTKELTEDEGPARDFADAFRTPNMGETLRNAPRLGAAKLREYLRQAQGLIAPESIGPEAQAAGSIIAKAISEEAQKTSYVYHRGVERKAFWDKNMGSVPDFIQRFERGETFADPTVQAAAEGYRAWNERIARQDAEVSKLKYEPVDNYLYHSFKDSAGVENYFNTKYGPKWGDPGFIKDRSFRLYEEAVKAGFEPRYKNPEDLMQARQHASDIAQMKVQTLDDLVEHGLAVKITKSIGADGKATSTPKPRKYESTFWRSPTGDGYWVHNSADSVMSNAFKSKGLWEMRGLGGDAFRGMMGLKNVVVPIKLAISAFHPLHVLGIDNAASMMRASKGLLSGETNPAAWLAQMVKSGFLYESLPIVGKNSRLGSRVLKVWQGKLRGEQLSAADKQALHFMAEGGFIPELSSQYRIKAGEAFTAAINQGKYAKAGVKAIPALIGALQKPIFERWIPGLKIASYLNDVEMAIRTNPSLLENKLARQVAFRKLAKSVDNRYGEMAYNTLFWNKYIKDISVASTLSLGWNLGFLREYGGGALDLGQAVTTKGGLPGKIAKGQLDRPMFVLAYTTAALAYGGLMSYMLSGQPPDSIKDYVYPKTGKAGPDGQPERVNTMFYTREFGSIAAHTKQEGLATGLWHTVESKASPLFDMVHSFISNKDFFGKEISNPDSPAYQQLEQRVAYALGDATPLSLTGWGEKSAQERTLAVAGFTPAPKYATQSAIEGDIASAYSKYVRPAETPYDKAQRSDDTRKLRKLADTDPEGYNRLLDAMEIKYDLTPKEVTRLEKSIDKDENPNLYMFSRLDWVVQKRILDKNWATMTEDERDDYLAKSNKEHLRDNYDPPGDK